MNTDPSRNRKRLAYIPAAALVIIAIYRATQRDYLAAAESLVFSIAVSIFATEQPAGRYASTRAWVIGALVILGLVLAFLQ